MLTEKKYKGKGNTKLALTSTNKYPPLTSKMIVELFEAITADNRTGSLSDLINGGFIAQKEISVNNHKEFQWEITDKGITILNNLGFEFHGRAKK